MKRFMLLFLLLQGIVLGQSTYKVAVSGNYFLGAGIHVYIPLLEQLETRVNLEFSSRPERDRFSPEALSLGLGADLIYMFDLSQSKLPEGLDVYAGAGLMGSYNFPSFVYQPFFALRATPFLGIQYLEKEGVFLEVGPELDFTPHFSVEAVDLHFRFKLGLVLFQF